MGRGTCNVDPDGYYAHSRMNGDNKENRLKFISAPVLTMVMLFYALQSYGAGNVRLIASEDFEGSMSCKLSSEGSYLEAPGIKSGMGYDGSCGYGFGRSTCPFNAWDGYVNDLVFTFSKQYTITKVEFYERERYGNWGSQGWLIANGQQIADTTFGRLPSNDGTADDDFRKREFSINVTASGLTFRCWDITDTSELFIDCIRIYGYADDEPPVLDVKPTSCDWKNGTITIGWKSEEENTSSASRPTYTVYWADSTNDFESADFFSNLPAKNKIKEGITGTTCKDPNYSKQGDGTQIIYYCVLGSDDSRGCCATRRRFGLFVGYTKYYTENSKIAPSAPEANDFWNKYIQAGGVEYNSTKCLYDDEGKVENLDLELALFAENVNVGDVFVFYCLTHGGNTEILCVDGRYKISRLGERLDSIGSKGVATITVLGTCHSGQIAEECGTANNKAWITATRGAESARGSSGTYTGIEFSYFGLAFLNWGWELGLAGKDGVASYYDLASYVKRHVKAFSSQHSFHPSMLNEDILKNVVAYSNQAKQNVARLPAPKGLQVETGSWNQSIVVSWNSVEGAYYYRVHWTMVGDSKEYWSIAARASCELPNNETLDFSLSTGNYRFWVEAVNGYGAGCVSDTVEISWEPVIQRIKRGLAEWFYEKTTIGMTIYNGKEQSAIEASTTGDVVIPTEIEGTNVVAIGDYAFYGCNKITSVTIPETVYSLGESVFECCERLTTVSFLGELPSGLVESGLLETSAKICYPHKYAAQYADVIPVDKFAGYTDVDTYEGATMTLGSEGSFTPVDTDGDGTYDQLSVQAQIETDKGGDYSWSVTLESTNGEEIVVATGTVTLSVGKNDVAFTFDSTDIPALGTFGPYVVKDIWFWNDDAFVQLPGMLEFPHLSSEDPIPDISEESTPEEVCAALNGSTDTRLQMCITNVTNYKAYREWANRVMTQDGSTIAGGQTVKEAANAWFSYATGSSVLISSLPTSNDVKVEGFQSTSEPGKFDFTLSINGVEVGGDDAIDKALLKENLKQVFGLEGSTTLDSTGFSVDNIDISCSTPENGKVKFTAGPNAKNADAKTFFMKVKITP